MPLQEIIEVFRSTGDTPQACLENSVTNNCVYFKIVPDFFNGDINYKLHVVAFIDGPAIANVFKGFGADFSQMNPPSARFVTLPPFENSKAIPQQQVKPSGKKDKKAIQ